MKTSSQPSRSDNHCKFSLVLIVLILISGINLRAQSVEIIGDEDSVFAKKILIEKIPMDFIPTVDVGSQSYSTLNSVAVGQTNDKFDKVFFDVSDYELTKYSQYDYEKGYADVLYVLLDVDKSEYKKDKGVFPAGIKQIEVIREKNNISNRLNSIESGKTTYTSNKVYDVLVLISYNP